MSYREIPEDRILEFKATPGFRGWKPFFTDESISHPAKMNLHLLRWILKTYTEPGEVILDPMAGTGSTTVLASLEGRHSVAVEYEPKFCEMIENNIKFTEKHGSLKPKGQMTCIQGDARELSQLLKESDTIITSPPYGNRLSDVVVHDGDLARMGYRQAVDAILTSPPFGPSTKGGGIFREGYKALGEEEVSDPGLPERHGRPLSEDPRNIDNLEYGAVDAVVTSPPYEDSVPAQDERWLEEHWDDESESPKHKTMRFGKSMGGYPKVDTVVTSPPYEGSETETGDEKGRRGGDSRLIVKKDYDEVSEENIGSMKGETYLEAMLQVYRECLKVLKPRGKMVLVVKNFIRDKQVVRLDLDTIKLCEAAGFRLADRWYFRLPTKSFWRILYRKKYPEVPEVEYEDVLIFEKANIKDDNVMMEDE